MLGTRWTSTEVCPETPTGLARARIWVKHHLLDPRFDNPDARMPDMQLTEPQADLLSRHLIPHTELTLLDRVRKTLRRPKPWYYVLTFALGALSFWVLLLGWRRFGSRRAATR